MDRVSSSSFVSMTCRRCGGSSVFVFAVVELSNLSDFLRFWFRLKISRERPRDPSREPTELLTDLLLDEENRKLEELRLVDLDLDLVFFSIKPSCLSRWSNTSTTRTSGAMSIVVVACFISSFWPLVLTIRNHFLEQWLADCKNV